MVGRPTNRSGSPNRRHFASLDLEKHAGFLYRRPTSQDIRGSFCGTFPVTSEQTFFFFFRNAQKKLFRIASGWGCVIPIASHIAAAASRDLGH